MDISLLKQLCETPGIPGREGAIRKVVRDAMQPIFGDLTIDPLGNVIGVLPGNGGPRVMLATHMDEIGFLVSHIDDKGFLRLQPLGGFDARYLIAQRVLVTGYTGRVLRGALMLSGKPMHLVQPADLKVPKLDELFVDLGMGADKVRAMVEVGDMVTLDRTLEVVGDCVVSKSLDDRVGIFIMLEAMKAMQGSAATIVAAATVQEEVGLRGAVTAAFAIEPDISIAIDITVASDIPGIEGPAAVTRMGSGAAIKLMDTSMISNPGLVRHLRDLAENNNIPHQLEILPRGGTDAGAAQRSRAGSLAVTLSIPTRYAHTVNEMAHLADIQACIDLLARFLEDVGNRNYEH